MGFAEDFFIEICELRIPRGMSEEIFGKFSENKTKTLFLGFFETSFEGNIEEISNGMYGNDCIKEFRKNFLKNIKRNFKRNPQKSCSKNSWKRGVGKFLEKSKKILKKAMERLQ